MKFPKTLVIGGIRNKWSIMKTKTLKPYAFDVSEPIFKSCCRVYVNMTMDDMITRIKLKFPGFNFKKVVNEDAGAYFFWFYYKPTEQNFPVLWVRKFDWSLAEQAIFIHELLHFIFYEARHKAILKSEEFFCYMLEYYVRECWRKLKKLY